MPTKPLVLVRGRVARMTRLDGCGRPVYGDNSVVTTKGWTTIALTANIDEGTPIVLTNANGENIVNDVPVARLTGYGITLTFGEVDPDLFAMMTGQSTVLDAFGNAVGFDVDTKVDAGDSGFALEVWAGSPTQRCSEAGQGTFGYGLLPFLQGGVLGDFTLENNAVTFTISNVATKEGNTWGVGPYNVTLDADGDPSPQLAPISPTLAIRLMLTELSPPEARIGGRPLLEADAANLTNVTVTSTALAATFTAVPAGTDPFWVDFGDGTWDYSENGANIVHTYETAGTYTAVTSRGQSTRTSTVTVSAI